MNFLLQPKSQCGFKFVVRSISTLLDFFFCVYQYTGMFMIGIKCDLDTTMERLIRFALPAVGGKI